MIHKKGHANQAGGGSMTTWWFGLGGVRFSVSMDTISKWVQEQPDD